jgi:pyruvate/2-oxoglutarate/acetoin dehydrogenase E1 component
MREITYSQALNEALREEMIRDEKVFLMGEDIGLHGGAFGVTKNLVKEFGSERVRNSPLSEAGIAGIAVGAALLDMKPVVEFMFVDFTTIAMDQIINQAAKIRYMTGGQVKVPAVFRAQGGAGTGSAAQHSQSLENLFCYIPGLIVVMPSTPYNAKGLLKSSIRNPNPVVFIEHKLLYAKKGVVPEEEYLLPLGKANLMKKGQNITFISYSRMVHVALDAAEQLTQEGIDAEVIDLQTLSPIDKETIFQSVQKTGKVVIVSEACKTGGPGGEIGMQIMENAFDYLDAPMVRLCAADAPVPCSRYLEDNSIPQAKDVVKTVKELLE